MKITIITSNGIDTNWSPKPLLPNTPPKGYTPNQHNPCFKQYTHNHLSTQAKSTKVPPATTHLPHLPAHAALLTHPSNSNKQTKHPHHHYSPKDVKKTPTTFQFHMHRATQPNQQPPPKRRNLPTSHNKSKLL